MSSEARIISHNYLEILSSVARILYNILTIENPLGKLFKNLVHRGTYHNNFYPGQRGPY